MKYDVAGCWLSVIPSHDVLRFCRCCTNNIGVYKYKENSELNMLDRSPEGLGN